MMKRFENPLIRDQIKMNLRALYLRLAREREELIHADGDNGVYGELIQALADRLKGVTQAALELGIGWDWELDYAMVHKEFC